MRVMQEIGPGSAPRVIFVHGAGAAGWYWKKQVEALPDFRRIVVDLADHGTDRETPFAGIEAAAEEIAALAAERGKDGRAHLVGHSLGAKIVLEVLARKPAVAESAVVSSSLVRDSALVRMMDSHSLNAFSLWMLRSDAIARLQAAQFAFPDDDMRAAYMADLRAMRTENLDRPIKAFCARLFPPPGLDRLHCPVLLTFGEKEPRVMQGSMRDLERIITGSRVAVISGGKHNYPWANHAAYNEILGAWLKEHSAV